MVKTLKVENWTLNKKYLRISKPNNFKLSHVVFFNSLIMTLFLSELLIVFVVVYKWKNRHNIQWISINVTKFRKIHSHPLTFPNQNFQWIAFSNFHARTTTIPEKQTDKMVSQNDNILLESVSMRMVFAFKWNLI